MWYLNPVDLIKGRAFVLYFYREVRFKSTAEIYKEISDLDIYRTEIRIVP
jgi:hypothetical protein